MHEEIAFIAYHFHWNRAEILHLEHRERTRWCDEISKIHERMNEDEVGGEQSIEALL